MEGGREEGRGETVGLMILWMTVHSVGVSSGCRAHAHPLHHRLGGGAWGEGAIMTYCSHDTVEPIIQFNSSREIQIPQKF